MATLETTDVALVRDGEYIKCGHIIHWLVDNYDSRCNDTYCFVGLDNEYLRRKFERKYPDVDYDEVSERLRALWQQVDSSLDKQGISLAQFIAEQDGYFYMHASVESELEEHDGDEFDCGTYVEAVLEDLEREFDIPIGTHASKAIEDFVRVDYPELIDALPVQYIPVESVC